jgi:hypothetical protein
MLIISSGELFFYDLRDRVKVIVQLGLGLGLGLLLAAVISSFWTLGIGLMVS